MIFDDSDFSEVTIKKIVELLLMLKNQANDIKGPSNFLLVDVLATIVIEALKFVQLVPSTHKELDKISKAINRYKKMKLNLEKYIYLN